MTKEDELYLEAIEVWRRNRGIGTFFTPAPLDSLKPLLMLLPNLYNRSPTCSTLIIVDDFKERSNVIEYLTTRNSYSVYNESFAKLINAGYIKVLTIDYVSDNINNINPLITVVYKPHSFTFGHLGALEKSSYKLVILTTNIGEDSINSYYSVCPLIDKFKQVALDEIKVSRPVKDVRIGLTIDKESSAYKRLEYLNKEISTTITIFGSFERIEAARIGDTKTNTSAQLVCNEIAAENGWNPDLDMSVQYNVEIDKLYNPNALKERASKTYELIRERGRLLASYQGKIDTILDIIDLWENHKILIINKYGEFASKVTDSINTLYPTNICSNYHDKVDNVPAIDKDGNPIYYKSGSKKGERKLMGVTAQKKLAQQMFNLGKLRVLSTSNAPDKSLDVDIDVVIITSPFCETIESYLYRLSNVKFANEVQLYTLYCKDTAESKRLDDISIGNNHLIVNKGEINVNIENNSDIVVVD